MDKIAIAQKHLAGFKELRPDNKSKPREPKKPKNETETNLKNYNKRLEAYPKKLEKWTEDDKRKKSMRQIEITADGVLTCGPPYRLVRLENVPNEMEETYYLEGEGEGFPNFGGVIDRLSNKNCFTLAVDKELINFVAAISKDSDVGEFTFGPRGILFQPPRPSQEDLLLEAKLERSLDLLDPFRVGISSIYLVGLFQLVKKLEIETLEIWYRSSIHPILFKDENFEYIIAPVRLN